MLFMLYSLGIGLTVAIEQCKAVTTKPRVGRTDCAGRISRSCGNCSFISLVPL